jgi:hypothetical protein
MTCGVVIPRSGLIVQTMLLKLHCHLLEVVQLDQKGETSAMHNHLDKYKKYSLHT